MDGDERQKLLTTRRRDKQKGQIKKTTKDSEFVRDEERGRNCAVSERCLGQYYNLTQKVTVHVTDFTLMEIYMVGFVDIMECLELNSGKRSLNSNR